MPTTKNLCAQINLDLYQKILKAREQSGLTTAQYITQLLTEYFEMKQNGGNITIKNNSTRTLAFQISEELFQRIKSHLERESTRTGHKLTQREFVLGLIEDALSKAESVNHGEANVEPCVASEEQDGTQPQEEGDPTSLSA